MFHRFRDIVETEGLSGLTRRSIAFAYRRGVRPWLPREPVRCAEIPICHDRRWGDLKLQSLWASFPDLADQPDYEAELVAGLNETIRAGRQCRRGRRGGWV